MNYKPYYYSYLALEKMYAQLYAAYNSLYASYNELLEQYNDLYNRNDNDVKIYQIKKILIYLIILLHL